VGVKVYVTMPVLSVGVGVKVSVTPPVAVSDGVAVAAAVGVSSMGVVGTPLHPKNMIAGSKKQKINAITRCFFIKNLPIIYRILYPFMHV
jgi:hypothetical protein